MATLRSEGLALAALLTTLVAFGPLSTDLYLPALPQIGTRLGASDSAVQWTLSVFLIGIAVSQLAYGPLSDRFGRRPVVLFGLAVYLAATIACAVAPSIEALILARFLQATGAGCAPVLARAIVRDVYGRDRGAAVLAYMGMAMTVAPLIGPILGGYLTKIFGWRANFWLLGLFGVTILAITASSLGETNLHLDPTATRPRTLAHNYLHLVRQRNFVGCTAVVACTYSGLFCFISGLPFLFIHSLGLTPPQFGGSFAIGVIGYMVGSFIAGRISARLGSSRMIAIGTAFSLGGGLWTVATLVAFGPRVDTVLLGFFLFMAGAALTMPNAMATGVGPFPKMAGLASALIGFAQLSVAALVGVVVVALADGSGISIGAALAIVTAFAAASYWLLVRPSFTVDRPVEPARRT